MKTAELGKQTNQMAVNLCVPVLAHCTIRATFTEITAKDCRSLQQSSRTHGPAGLAAARLMISAGTAECYARPTHIQSEGS